MERTDSEKDLTFLGLIVMENRIKKEAKPTIDPGWHCLPKNTLSIIVAKNKSYQQSISYLLFRLFYWHGEEKSMPVKVSLKNNSKYKFLLNCLEKFE